MSDSQAKPENYTFTIAINWKVCVFSLIFIPLLIRLGFWQLQRAEEKRTIQQLVEQQQALPPQSVEKLLDDVDAGVSLLYRRAQSRGLFDTEHYWLIENRTYRGKNGYEVVAPLLQNNVDVVLVNLGWVEGTGYRDQLPKLTIPKEPINISGHLVIPSVNRLLADEVRPVQGWPKVVLQLDLASMEKELEKKVFPYIIEADSNSPYAFLTNWTVVNSSVSKHLGYAYQWFAMACALIVLTLFANTNIGRWFKN